MADSVAVVGAGPAGLMAAEVLARGGVTVTVFDRMPSAGRKFLMAGRGGLNLTHSEAFMPFMARYGAAAEALRPAITAFGPERLRAWCEGLGEATFVGSSGRVFPKSLKASPLLRAWLRRLGDLGVVFKARHRFIGWDRDGALRFETPDGSTSRRYDATVLALGGASWSRLGSDGGWVAALAKAGVGVAPLRPANCGALVDWSRHFRDRFAGAPLKRIALSLGEVCVRGEAVVTRSGLEGGAVYALSAALREVLDRQGGASIMVDLRPDIAATALARRLAGARGKMSMATFLRKTVRLAPVAIGLLHERPPLPLAQMSADALAALIKGVPVRIAGLAGLDRAISSAGGVRFANLDAGFMLRNRPGTFVAGEMLDWEAPTGGYLLQACFATGVAAAEGALRWLSDGRGSGRS